MVARVLLYEFFLLHCYVVAMKPLMVVLDGRLLKDLTFENPFEYSLV